MDNLDTKSIEAESARFRDLLAWLHAYAGAGEAALLGVGLYVTRRMGVFNAWHVRRHVVLVMQNKVHDDFITRFGNGARGVYDLACEVRGRFGFSWTDAISIACNVRDHEARPVTGSDIAARKAFEEAEAECLVAFMERDGIDPAHIEEVRQLLL